MLQQSGNPLRHIEMNTSSRSNQTFSFFLFVVSEIFYYFYFILINRNMTRYSTALSHIVLALAAIYCYVGTRMMRNGVTFAQCSFVSMIGSSILGIWRWGNPMYGRSSDKIYKFTLLLQDLLALPCILTTVWLKYGYRQEIAYTCTILSTLLPLLTYLLCDKKEKNKDLLMNTIIGVNCVTLGILSFNHHNYYGVSACLSYAFNHFVIRNECETFNVPSQDLYNYSMCFFAFFSLNTILDLTINN